MNLTLKKQQELHQSIPAALKDAGVSVSTDHLFSSHHAIPGPFGADVRAQMDRGFLVLDTAPPLKKRTLWHLLRCNATILPGLKYVISEKGHPLRLRAEILLTDNGVDLPTRIRQACQGFHRAREICRTGGNPYDPRPTKKDRMFERFEGLCAECGWSFSQRNQDERNQDKRNRGAAIRLPVSEAYYEARVFEREGVGLIASVQLTAGKGWTRAYQSALAQLLLTTCGRIRMVRAAATPIEDGATAVSFEVAFGEPVGVVYVDHGLSALSAACLQWRKGVRAFQDKKIVKHYLRIRGCST